MPTYDYKCKSCEYTFDRFLTISKRNIPTEEPCPHCGENNSIEIAIGLSSIVSGVRIKDKRSDSFKDVLRNIKDTHPGNNISI